MGALTKADILDANDRPLKKVDVPEWGGHVFIRIMGGDEKDEFEARQYEINASGVQKNFRSFRARLVSITVTDEAGNRLFDESDVPALGAKSAAALDRVMNAALRANAFGPRDVEDLTKNSLSAPSGVSGSGSPENSECPSARRRNGSTRGNSRSGKRSTR